MSFAALKPYFQDRMATVDPELKEWEDAFNIENIPSNILDKSWHIAVGSANYTGTAHTCVHFSCPITLSVFFKGYRVPKEAVDSALVMADAIVKECVKPLNRLNQANIKNVLPSLVNVRELGQSNDNVAVLEISFSCEVVIDAKN